MNPRRLSGVSVYQKIERELSVGDRIQFTAPDKSLKALQIATWPRSRRSIPTGACPSASTATARSDSNVSEHRHLYHGYAVTSHSCQGLAANAPLVHADTSVHPGLLNSRFAYVSTSRASHEATEVLCGPGDSACFNRPNLPAGLVPNAGLLWQLDPQPTIQDAVEAIGKVLVNNVSDDVRMGEYVRLNSAIGYITPKAMLAGHQQEIQADRDRKLEA
jgi:hypothetical protein